MTLQGLYEQIGSLLKVCPQKGSDIVCVEITGSTFGMQPTEKIKNASCGFDWDDGKFILYPENKVYTLNANTN